MAVSLRSVRKRARSQPSTWRASTSASSVARLALMPAFMKRSRAPCTRSWMVMITMLSLP